MLVRGERVALRRPVVEDLDPLVTAYRDGEWQALDAPFEPRETDPIRLSETILGWCEDRSEPPRRALVVSTADGAPLGVVTRYAGHRIPEAWNLGVGLFRARDWGQGLGAEALTLWIDLLFDSGNIHRLGLNTWSLNPRMIRLAAKLGFRPEGVERELIEWQGEWLDRHGFGMLREEWESLRRGDAAAPQT